MIDKKIIARNFSRGAKNYDEAAEVQAIAARELVELVLLHESSTILDLGSGTSFIAKEILKKNKNVKITEVDISAEMLKSWVDRPSNVTAIQADIENLSFEKNSFDLIISSFSLQWISDFEKNFSRFFELLKPNGIFAFCLPLDGSLHELKSQDFFNFNALPQLTEIKSALAKSGFHTEKFIGKTITQNFQDGREALRSLKEIGANSSSSQKKILTKKQLEQFDNFCLKNCAGDNKNFSISWSLSFFIAKKQCLENS